MAKALSLKQAALMAGGTQEEAAGSDQVRCRSTGRAAVSSSLRCWVCVVVVREEGSQANSGDGSGAVEAPLALDRLSLCFVGITWDRRCLVVASITFFRKAVHSENNAVGAELETEFSALLVFQAWNPFKSHSCFRFFPWIRGMGFSSRQTRYRSQASRSRLCALCGHLPFCLFAPATCRPALSPIKSVLT